MFKKNPLRPPMVVQLKRLPNGYKVVPSEASNLFQIKRVTRTMYRPDLIQAANMNIESQGIAISSTIIQPPSHVTLPAFAGWFRLDSIHAIEREAFPEFFTEGVEEGFSFTRKNPQLYRYYRNTIIGMWRENVKKHLSSAQCRRNLVGDVSCIVRIHGFLENWGLINFPSKQHSKGVIARKPDRLACYVCEDPHSASFRLANIDGVILQLCEACFQAGLFSQEIAAEEFVEVEAPEQQPEGRVMTRSQLVRLVELLGNAVGPTRERDREAWQTVQREFPHFTREDLVFNFLRVPLLFDMNANIFQNNEDVITHNPSEDHRPSFLQDFQNPLQASIAVAYYAWEQQKKRQQQKKGGKTELDLLFAAAEQQARELAIQQAQKIDEVTKMMVEVTYSKLENKSLFIYQYQKLIQRSNESNHRLVTNTLAESLKQNVRMLERQEGPEQLQQEQENQDLLFA